MEKKRYHRVILCILLAGFLSIDSSQGQEELFGNYGGHDPSTIIKEGNTYFYFTTGSGIPYHTSTDLINWSYGGQALPGGPPAWVDTAVPDYDPGNWNWAPDVAYFNGKYHVYYSVSSWGSIDSVIGLITSPSLTNPTWTDRGKVVQSDAAGQTQPETDTTAYNCIDPSILVDTDDKVWMTFGSYSSGILITEINPDTGLRMNTSTLDAVQVANNRGGGWGSSIEGAFTYKKNGYYYLFVNYGGCCSGIDSTYNIRVGRSTSVTGPYRDRNGVDMRSSGGTMLLESSGRFVGPGHPGILSDNGTEWFSYHYYTWGEFGGWVELGLAKLSWDEAGWPVLPNDWSALYTFNTDAREQMGFYDGSLQNGASIVTDDVMGSVLELDSATDQYVELHQAVANCSSVATWVKWNGGGDWQRIFDFGTDTDDYMFLTPQAYDGNMRFGIKAGGGEQTIEAPFMLPTNTWCHVAVTLDGEEGIIYLNGEPVASNPITVRPWEMLARSNYVGRSHFDADPYFDGRIASFRVFAHALSPEEVQEIAYTHPALAHRYSFDSDVRDSVGMAHGQLKGSATVTNGTLSLPGSNGSYAQLPGALVSGGNALSIEFWADIESNGNWARIFDFGNISGSYGNNFLFLTTGMNASQYRMDMNGAALDVTGTLNNTSAHVVCIVDPSVNYTAIYINGDLVKQQTVSTPALSTLGRAWSFLGRSLFSADPYLNGDIDEFRVYDCRLTPQQIADHFAAGPDVIYQPSSYNWTHDAENLSFQWPSFPAGYSVEYKTALTDGAAWTPMNAPLPNNGTHTLSMPIDSISSSNAFFRLNR